MSNNVNRSSDRRRALSILLRYAEQEAQELKEEDVAERIRDVYLNMEASTVAAHNEIMMAVGNKFHS